MISFCYGYKVLMSSLSESDQHPGQQAINRNKSITSPLTGFYINASATSVCVCNKHLSKYEKGLSNLGTSEIHHKSV